MKFETRGNDGVLVFGTLDGKSLTLQSGASVELSGVVTIPESGRVMVIGKIVDDQTINAIDVKWLK